MWNWFVPTKELCGTSVYTNSDKTEFQVNDANENNHNWRFIDDELK